MKRAMSYPQFLKAIAGYELTDLEDIIADASRTFQLFPEYQSYGRLYSGIYIVIYPLRKYAYVNDNLAKLVGTSVPYIKGNGIGDNEELYYTPDDKVHDEKIFANNLAFLQDVPVRDHPRHLMSCNFRVYNRKRDLRNMLQESYFIKSAPDGLPLAALGFITDISHIRNDNRMGQAIYNENGEVFSACYYSGMDGKKLSLRQIEIVKLVCDGLITKEIATRLHISEKTVDNHKQNIRMITNSRNVAEVIKFALDHGYWS